MANYNVQITNGIGSESMKKGTYDVTVTANGYESTSLSPTYYTATESQGTGNFTVSANGVSVPCKTSLGGVYNVYNFVCAAAVLGAVGISDVSLLTGFSGAFGRMETFSDNTCRVMLMLVKNPVGFSSCAAYAASLKNVDRVLLALNDNAADGRDVSWIWDSELDSLCSLKCDFYTFGVRADDMTVRLKYNGITVADTLCGEDMSALIHLVKQGGFSVIIANYTAMMKLRRALRRTFGGKEFWQ